jgi:transposase
MTKSQVNSTWVEQIYHPKDFQMAIFTGYEFSMLNQMTIIIDSFVDSIDLSCFDKHFFSNEKTGGRPFYEPKKLLKIYLYALYKDISINTLHEHNCLGSQLYYLSQSYPGFPERRVFTRFLKILDLYILDIFFQNIVYLRTHTSLNTSCLYGDGTIFEAHNNRHKIITDTNIARSNKKWTKILEDPDSDEKSRNTAKEKLALNIERSAKLKDFERTSYGRTDEDSVILKAKNGSFIAGFNVQFIEESNHGFIVYPHVSNKNPDSAAFVGIIDDINEKYHPADFVLDTGYGTPDILLKLTSLNINPVIKALKNENANKKITDYSFELSENDDCLICPEGQMLERVPTKVENMVAFKGQNCDLCPLKSMCLDKAKHKRVTINLEEFKAFKKAEQTVNSEKGKDLYSHRGNICESPNGFIIYNLNGGKFKMKGQTRGTTIVCLYAILYNLRRLISVKSVRDK